MAGRLHDDDDDQQADHLDDEDDAGSVGGDDDPRKQYVAVQLGHDIPLKGLRKPAPQPNIYKGEFRA